MGHVISKEVRVSELYTYALTQALQTNFIISEDILDEIHLKIINELKLKCKPLADQGVISKEDISTKLDYDVAPLLEDAKQKNLKRVFTLVSENLKLENDDHCYTIVDGQHNWNILANIRKWLGQAHDSFSDIAECVKNKMLDDIGDQLSIKSLFPKILQERVTLKNKCALRIHTYVLIIEVSLQVHDFNFCKPTKYTKICTNTLNCSIYKESGIKMIINGNGNFAFCFPLCEKCDVKVRFDADVVFNVIQLLDQTSALTSPGQKLEKKFAHTVSLDMKLPYCNIKLVKAIQIKATEERADNFRHLYQHFKEIANSKAQQSTTEIPGANFLSMYSRFSWLEFVETLRKGSVDAAFEIIKKKPAMIQNLPDNENIVLGVAFEELQIAKILAEIKKRNIPVKVIQGDGLGSFTYMNKVIKTPEYTDVVLSNMATGELFGIQFKYSTKGENLVHNIERWERRWSSKNDQYDPKLPDALKLENIKVIGPKDVMKEMSFLDISSEVRCHVELDEPSWAKYPVDDKETIKTFLKDNKDLLEKIISSEEFQSRKSIKTNLKKLKKSTKKGNGANNSTKQGKLEINKVESSLQDCITELKDNECAMRSDIHQSIDLNYRKQYLKSTVWKEARLNVAVQTVTDGLVACILTFGNELEKLQKNEISFDELIATITQKTVIASAKGTLLASTFMALRLAATYATAYKLYSDVLLTTASNSAFPMYIIGSILKQSYDIISNWWKGDLTEVQMVKSFLHLHTSIGLNFLAGIGSSFIGGPMGLVVGAGLAIVVNVGDYYLGNKFWNLFFEDDKGDESVKSKENKVIDFRDDVVRAAYDFLRLTEQASKEEIKEKYKAAILKCHPDKGGDNKSFCAVRACYSVICEAKGI